MVHWPSIVAIASPTAHKVPRAVVVPPNVAMLVGPPALDLHRGADVHPVIEVLCRVSLGQGHPYATVRRGPVRHRGETVNEYVAVNLNAPRHRREVVFARAV